MKLILGFAVYWILLRFIEIVTFWIEFFSVLMKVICDRHVTIKFAINHHIIPDNRSKIFVNILVLIQLV